MAALRWISLMNFSKTDSVPSLFLTDLQKLFRKKHLVLLLIFILSVVLVPPGLASHSVALR